MTVSSQLPGTGSSNARMAPGPLQVVPAANGNPATLRLPDGRAFSVRPLRPDDVAALRRAFLRLTPEEVEYRFFYRSRELPASVSAQVQNLDPTRDAAFVVDDAGEIRAVVDMHIDRPDGRVAEFGLIVGKAVSGHGIGRYLMRTLLDEARRRHVVSLTGSVLSENARMLVLCRELGATVAADPDDPAVRNVTFRP
ncbi:MAG TPA: GNAT family N-acetyltransferase [Rhodanobacteraceae bacterium]